MKNVSIDKHRGADKSLARPGRKQATFPAFYGMFITAFSIVHHLSLTWPNQSKPLLITLLTGAAFFIPGRTKDLSAPRYVLSEFEPSNYRSADKSLARPQKKQTRKHVRDARDFNNIETRAVIKIFSLQRKAPKEIHAILTETLACFLSSQAKDLSAPLFIQQYLIFFYQAN